MTADPTRWEIQYLGQVGFRLSDGETTVVVDPYLSSSVDSLPEFPAGYWQRNYPPPVRAQDLRQVDLVICTHDHLDHTDPATLLEIARASPGCVFGGPRHSVETMLAAGLPEARTRVLNEDVPFVVNDVRIEPVAAAHESYEIDADGYHRFLAYLIRWQGKVIFHAGDTVVTAELSQRLSRERIDLGFLPINGGDEKRRAMGIVGNMNEVEAAELASRHRFGWVVPTHYDLYACNAGRLEIFQAEVERRQEKGCPRIKAFAPGESMHWRPSAPTV